MLSGKNAVITGSTSGIGLGIAKAMAAAGANIMLNGFGDAAEIEAIRADLAETCNVQVGFIGSDLSTAAGCEELIAASRDKLGQIDILVNNAGIQYVSPVEDFPIEKWDAIIAINLSSAFHTTRLVVPEMKERKWGRIINIASAHAHVASPFKSAYVAAKHGMLGLTKTVALEVAEFGVTCNTICPGYVLTPLVEKQIPDTAKARGITEEEVKRDVILHAQPTKKFVTIEDLGALAVFVASEPAASMTGASLSMDGGMIAQ